jgi:hypothetical protein
VRIFRLTCEPELRTLREKMGGMWVIPAVVVLLLLFAAAADWQARRAGRTQRAAPDYWDAVSKARREARSRMFRRHRRFGP